MGGLGVRLGRRISAIASSPPIAKVLTRLIKFGFGYLISGGVVLDGWAPFGLAFAAGMGTSNGAVFGIIGAMIGYFRIMAYANGLKYIAICILIYTVGFVFRGTWLTKHAWFMPISAGVCTAAIGFVFVAQMGFPLAQTVFFATEVMLVCLCTHLLGCVRIPRRRRRGKHCGGCVFHGGRCFRGCAGVLCHLRVFSGYGRNFRG